MGATTTKSKSAKSFYIVQSYINAKGSTKRNMTAYVPCTNLPDDSVDDILKVSE